jgi:hypothetical protein
MRRRLMLLPVLMLVVGAMTPAVAVGYSSNGYTGTTLASKCKVYPINGATAYSLTFKMRIDANGSTPADELRISSILQRKTGGASNYTTITYFPDVSKTFAADGTTHSLTLKRQHGFTINAGDPSTKYRMIFLLGAFDNSQASPDQWYYQKKSIACGS